MIVDQYTLEIPVDQCIEIVRDGKAVFMGTIRELQVFFYTLAQCEIVKKPYLLANTHHVTIK